MDDVSSCCDAHDICYGTCGMTQVFCDLQLHNCMQSQASLPQCQMTIDVTDLVLEVAGCDNFVD